MSHSEEFGALLSQGLHSIAAHEDKILLSKDQKEGVKREIADELGLTHWSVDKWMQGDVPTPKKVALLAEACVKRGKMDEQWLDQFLTSVDFSDKRTLRQKLFPATKPAIRHNLPPRLYKFVGREKELGLLRHYLKPNHRAISVCISGQAGVGKTAIALEIAHFYKLSTKLPDEERFDAIVWVTAKEETLTPRGIVPHRRTFSDLDTLYRAIAEVLGLREAFGYAATIEERNIMIDRALREQRVLLILDNFEDIDDDNFISFLDELPDPSKAIVTTRHRIFMSKQIEVKPFHEPEARKLVEIECERLNLSLSDEETDKLLRNNVYLPLAIKQALGRMIEFGSSVEAELHHLKDVPNNKIYEFSFESSIGPIRGTDAHKLFMALVLFQTDARRDAVGYVAGFEDTVLNDVFDRDRGLGTLERLSLVSKADDRFSLETLTKLYAQEELKASQDFQQEALKRMVAYYLKFAKDHGGKDRGEWNERYKPLEVEWENLYYVFDMCVERGNEDYFYCALKDFWQSGGVLYFAHLRPHWNSRIKYLTALANLAKDREDWSTWVKATVDKAYTLTLRGQLAAADSLFRQAWDRRASTNYVEQIRIAEHFSRLCTLRERYEDAASWLEQASNLFDKIHLDEPERSRRKVTTLNFEGFMYFKMGHRYYPDAERCLTDVVHHALKDDFLRTAVSAKSYLAEIYIDQDRLDEAEELTKWGLEVSLRNESFRFAAPYQRSYARLYAKRGEVDKAKRWAEEALESFKRVGMQQEIDQMSDLLQILGIA